MVMDAFKIHIDSLGVEIIARGGQYFLLYMFSTYKEGEGNVR